MRMKLFLIIQGIFFTEMMADITRLEAALRERWQQVTSFCNSCDRGRGHRFSLVGKEPLCTFCLLMYFWFDEGKEKCPLRQILNEATNIQFLHPSYSKERNFQLLGKSRKNIQRGSESKCSFFFPQSVQILPTQRRRLQSRKPQGTAHCPVFLWETVTSPWLEHN